MYTSRFFRAEPYFDKESTIFMAMLCIIVFSPIIYQVALKRLHEHAPNSFPTQDKQNCLKV